MPCSSLQAARRDGRRAVGAGRRRVRAAAHHADRPGARLARRQRVARRRSPHETHKLGYDKPLPQQYVNYVTGMFHGNLQMSLRTRRAGRDRSAPLPARDRSSWRSSGWSSPPSSGGSSASLTAARLRGSGSFRFVTLAGASTPPFLLALLGILFFYHDSAGSPRPAAPVWPTHQPARPVSSPSTPCSTATSTASRTRSGTCSFPALCVAILPAVSIGRVLRSSLVTDDALRLRAHGAIQGPARDRVLWGHAHAQQHRPGAVDGRPAGRPHVRRRRGHRVRSSPGPASASTPCSRSRAATSPRSPASPSSSAPAT